MFQVELSVFREPLAGGVNESVRPRVKTYEDVSSRVKSARSLPSPRLLSMNGRALRRGADRRPPTRASDKKGPDPFLCNRAPEARRRALRIELWL